MDAFNNKVLSITRSLNTGGIASVNKLRRSLRGSVDGVRSSLTKVKIGLYGVAWNIYNPLLGNIETVREPFKRCFQQIFLKNNLIHQKTMVVLKILVLLELVLGDYV
jgi:hypothetical protein